MIRITITSLAVLAISACATIALPPDQLQAADASIRGAEELGALNVPDARMHLELAKDEKTVAAQLALNGDERAPLVLARADADAELALGLAREVSVHAEAMRADSDLKAVQARGTP